MALLRQIQETSLRERERERGPLSCDSAFHQGTGRERHKTRHASPLVTPSASSPPHPLSHPLLPIQPPSLPSASDLNIYQRTPCWNSSSASVSWWERHRHRHTHTHAYTAQSHIKVHMHCRKPICFEYCKTVEGPSLFLTKEAALETMSH